ncbi:MAG TPA: HipA domain-containing protein [Chryseosolibacter sp.]|nr:HipA domain-containing protein [Chryseosolibacter sp.]
MKTDRCPSTLRQGFDTYSPTAKKKVFSGKQVSHVLPFLPPEKDEEINEAFLENRKRLSISGVQKKLSLRLEKNKLRLTKQGEHGQYILKPIPDDIKRPDQVPANEHVTMQIAAQVFKISTAPNAMIFFNDGQPAYITKRFDYKKDGSKYGMEDFASLAQMTRDTRGVDFKYDGSYEDIFQLLKKYVGPYKIEAQKLFRLILFNYVFCNGDAHLKNYSLIETEQGDYILSPAYDLLNTRIHVNDADVALKKGLFNDHETESYKANGYYAFDDFFELGKRAELPDAIIKSEITLFLKSTQGVQALLSQSFLESMIKSRYIQLFDEKINRLNYSFKKLS